MGVRLPIELVPKEDTTRKEFFEAFGACRLIREALAALLTKRLNSAIIESEGKSLLDSPNYLLSVSDNLAYRRGLREAIALLRPETDL